MTDEMINDIFKATDEKTLVIMCGPPGSGKTTLAKRIADTRPNYYIISPDDIREELTGDPNDQSKNIEVFDKVYNRIGLYLDQGCNVIYDATNCRSNYRTRILDACANCSNKIIALVSTVPIYKCIQQNENRERHVPEDIIEKMYFTLRKHPPTLFEGFDILIRF